VLVEVSPAVGLVEVVVVAAAARLVRIETSQAEMDHDIKYPFIESCSSGSLMFLETPRI